MLDVMMALEGIEAPTAGTRRPEARLKALDAVLEAGGDLGEFGSATLKAYNDKWLSSSTASTTPRDSPRAGRRAAAAPAPASLTSSASTTASSTPRASTPAPFGADTLRGFALGAPPAGFPSRDGASAASSPRTSPRGGGVGPTISPRRHPLHGAAGAFRQQAHQQHQQPIMPQPTITEMAAVVPMAPVFSPRSGEWRLTGEMMHQPWGKVLRTLQPDASNVSRAAAPESPRQSKYTQQPGHLSARPMLRYG